jgi:hypothetical protein
VDGLALVRGKAELYRAHSVAAQELSGDEVAQAEPALRRGLAGGRGT